MTKTAVELARHANQPERAAMYEVGLAVREAFFKEGRAAQRDAMAARALSDGRDVVWGAAMAMALSGEIRRSETLAGDLEKRFPNDTVVRLTYLPVLRALAALRDQDAPKALDTLQTAAPIELGVPGSWTGLFGNLYPPYVRGLASMAQRRGGEAAPEFRKVTDHPAIAFSDPAVFWRSCNWHVHTHP